MPIDDVNSNYGRESLTGQSRQAPPARDGITTAVSAVPGPPLRTVGRRPSGTIAFAFTDIEGSTSRWERDRLAMEDALRRHDALLRAAIERHDGHVFKTIGDAFCAAFARAEDAVAAMLDVQRTLAAEDFTAVGGIRVRCALHVGTADERDDDYFGPSVNRAARLLALANGGQILASRAVADLVRELLPPHTALRDLGEHRLKDVTLPEHVYQLVAPGIAFRFSAPSLARCTPEQSSVADHDVHRPRKRDHRDRRAARARACRDDRGIGRDR